MAKESTISMEASQASITTATVTIKVLQVNSRQLTQSTFRQLPVRELIDWRTLELLGVVWGWVNYTPAGCSPRDTQFVTQFGSQLCRCPVWLHEIRPLTYADEYTSDGRIAKLYQTLFFARAEKAGRKARNDEDDYVARWNALVEDLRTAEQLYIAT